MRRWLKPVFGIALFTSGFGSAGVESNNVFIPANTNLVCTSYPDGIILCRDKETGRRVQECKRLADDRIVCRPGR